MAPKKEVEENMIRSKRNAQITISLNKEKSSQLPTGIMTAGQSGSSEILFGDGAHLPQILPTETARRPHLSLSSNRSVLHIYPAHRSDAGLYTCLASNSVGDGQSNAGLLRVTRKYYVLY